MTREEAIADIRDNIKPVVGGKSLDMAIQALEQPTYEDCISRKDFIAKIKDIYYGYMLDDDGCCPQDFVDLAEEMPPVTPQQKVWKWIETYEPNDAEPFIIWKCECCGLSERIKTHYCPNCGAKMEVSE